MIQKKPFYTRWWFFAIIAFIILAVIFSPTDEERAELEAEEAAQVAEVKADMAAEKKAKEDAKKSEKDAEQAEIDKAIADFDETRQALIATTEGSVTDVKIEWKGAHYKVDVYVDEAVWAASSESEKESSATTAGTLVQDGLPDQALVDFRSATNDDIVAEGKLLGGYDIKR